MDWYFFLSCRAKYAFHLGTASIASAVDCVTLYRMPARNFSNVSRQQQQVVLLCSHMGRDSTLLSCCSQAVTATLRLLTKLGIVRKYDDFFLRQGNWIFQPFWRVTSALLREATDARQICLQEATAPVAASCCSMTLPPQTAIAHYGCRGT